MARYEHLPIYRAAMDMAVFMEGQVRNMSRYNNYTTGMEREEKTLCVLSLGSLAFFKESDGAP